MEHSRFTFLSHKSYFAKNIFSIISLMSYVLSRRFELLDRMSYMTASAQQQQLQQQQYISAYRDTPSPKFGTPLANGHRVQTFPSASFAEAEAEGNNYVRTYSFSGRQSQMNSVGVGYANNYSKGYAKAAVMRCASTAQPHDASQDWDVPTAAATQQFRAAAAPSVSRNHSNEECWQSTSSSSPVHFAAASASANANGAQQTCRKRSGDDSNNAANRSFAQLQPQQQHRSVAGAPLSPRLSSVQAPRISPNRSTERFGPSVAGRLADNNYYSSSEALFFSTPKKSSAAPAVRSEMPRKSATNMYDSDYLQTPIQQMPRKSLGNANYEREYDSNGSAGELERSPKKRLVRRSQVEDESGGPAFALSDTMRALAVGGGGRSTSPSERAATGHQRFSEAPSNAHRPSESGPAHYRAHAGQQPPPPPQLQSAQQTLTRARLFVALVSYNVDDGCDAPANGDIWFRKGQILQVLRN